jgi:hypothetical protein
MAAKLSKLGGDKCFDGFQRLNAVAADPLNEKKICAQY